MQKKLVVVSLFSGAGGFDWGFHHAGFQTQVACEKLEDASKTVAKNLGLKIVTPKSANIDKVPSVIHGDIQEVDFSSLKITPDVLIGGPPCQDFSMVQGSQRQGLNGGRGKLYVQFIRAVMFLQPKIFVFENVPGLISANSRLAYDTIIGDLSELEKKRNEVCNKRGGNFHAPTSKVEGYEILFNNIVDATKIGIPQTRRRLIIIGLRKDLANSISKSDLSDLHKLLNDGLSGGNTLFSKFPMTCLEIFEGRPLVDLQKVYQETIKAYQSILQGTSRPAVVEWKARVWDNLQFDVKEDYFTVNQIGTAFQSKFEEAMEEHKNLLAEIGSLGNSLSAKAFSDSTNEISRQSSSVVERMHRIPPDENYSFVDGTQWEVAGKNISFIYRRLSPLKPAPTVMAYGGGGTHGYHYSRDRFQLTLRERARIQTFSDDFIFEGNVAEIRAQIGEAVPPILGKRIGSFVKEILKNI